MTITATAEIQIIEYDEPRETDHPHFSAEAPKIGPVAFVSSDGVCQEGWVDGIITSVVEVDLWSPQVQWVITVHSVTAPLLTPYAVIVNYRPASGDV